MNGFFKTERSVASRFDDRKVIEMVKNTVASADGRETTYSAGKAVITYKPKSFVKNSIISRNALPRSNAKKVTLESDYNFAQVERFYEKEGLLRKYVVTSVGRAMNAAFNLIPNPQMRDADKWHAKIVDRYNAILYNSNTHHEELVQTIIKEVFEFGNSIVRKNRTDGKIDGILSDDLLFYRFVVDPDTMELRNYARAPRFRPKPHSEDTYNWMQRKNSLFASLTQTDTLWRDQMRFLGYTGRRWSRLLLDEIYTTDDIIHFRYLVEKNTPVSMPPAMAAMVDIQDMKTLEENMVFLGWQYGHPILQITVNTEGLITQTDVDREIERAVMAVESMDSTGFLVTTERLKVNLIYPNGTMIPIEKFVDYMQGKISRNLDTAPLLMGDGANAGRQAGEAIEAVANDIIQMVCTLVGRKIERNLLLDIYRDINPEIKTNSYVMCPTIVKVRSVDSKKRAAEINHLTNMVDRLVIPPDRLLTELGMDPLSNKEIDSLRVYADLRKGLPSSGTTNPQNQFGEQLPGSAKRK